MIVGGGDLAGTGILERFLELAGGAAAPIVVIPTAGGQEEYDQHWPGLSRLRRAGARDLRVLHTVDRREADTEPFVEPIREARGVWFPGGRQWRLADAYLHTRVHEEIRALLDRGGVVGGSSAGATIQGSYLVRGDTETNTIMMGDHTEGFGVLQDVGIDQHLLKRNRHFDLVEVIDAHPELLGIGIDEGTAIVVRGDQFEVIGRSYVFIYDHERMLANDDAGNLRPIAGRFYALAAGDVYDLTARSASRPTTVPQPLMRIAPKAWP